MVEGTNTGTLLVSSPMGDLLRLRFSSPMSLCDCGQHFTAASWGQLVAENALPAMLASSYDFQYAALQAWRGKFNGDDINAILTSMTDYH